MKREIEFYELELTGWKRIKNAVNRSYGVYAAHVYTKEGSFMSKRGKRTNRGVEIN